MPGAAEALFLLRSTESLARALLAGDEAALREALEARRQAFERLPDPMSTEGRETLGQVAALDRRIGAAARRVLRQIERELVELRGVRASARKLDAGERPARFVSQRA